MDPSEKSAEKQKFRTLSFDELYDYIKALEHENKSRNSQRVCLEKSIEKLEDEIVNQKREIAAKSLRIKELSNCEAAIAKQHGILREQDQLEFNEQFRNCQVRLQAAHAQIQANLVRFCVLISEAQKVFNSIDDQEVRGRLSPMRQSKTASQNLNQINPLRSLDEVEKDFRDKVIGRAYKLVQQLSNAHTRLSSVQKEADNKLSELICFIKNECRTFKFVEQQLGKTKMQLQVSEQQNAMLRHSMLLGNTHLAEIHELQQINTSLRDQIARLSSESRSSNMQEREKKSESRQKIRSVSSFSQTLADTQKQQCTERSQVEFKKQSLLGSHVRLINMDQMSLCQN